MASQKNEDQRRVERLVCSVCMEVFCDPKLLPCHHTFCLACLHDLVASSPQQSSFPCPNCRANVSVPAGGLSSFQSNFYLLSEELEAAREAISEVSSSSRHPGTGTASSQQQATSPSATETGTAAQSNVPDTSSDWLLAFHFTGENLLSNDSHAAIPSVIGSQRQENQREEGELEQAIEESLRTYQNELRRRQERRQAEQPREVRGLQAAVASEAVRRWSQRRQSGEPREQAQQLQERPGLRQHNIPEEQPRNVDEIVRLRRNEREEKDEQEQQRQREQRDEQLQELQRKFSEILTRRTNQRGQQRQEGEPLGEQHRRLEPQTGQEPQTELLQAFQRLRSRRGEDKACGEQAAPERPPQEHRAQDLSARAEQRTQDLPARAEQRTQGLSAQEKQTTHEEHGVQDQPAQGERDQPREQGPHGGRQWESRSSGEFRPHQQQQDHQRESSPGRELADVLLRRRSKQGEPTNQEKEHRKEEAPQAPVAAAADTFKKRQTLAGGEGAKGQLQKELAQVLGKRHSQQ